MRKQFLAGVAAAALTGAFSGGSVAQPLPLMNWSGFYTGVHAGWGQARFSGTWINTSSPGVFPFRTKPSGFLGGVHAGQNWQTNTFVYGWEADVSGTGGWKKTVNMGDPNNSSASVLTKVSLLASLRGRLGVTLDPNTLVYLTGGLGYTQAKATASHTGEQGTMKFDTFGGVVGAGVERKHTQNFSWRLETLWYIFNKSKSVLLPSGFHTINVKLKDAVVVRAGATWHY